jgi:DNA-binding NtrC family response regulator
MGGGIQVASRVEGGTTFRIFFPVVADAPFGAVPAPSSRVRGEGRILVVDDEETVTTLLEAALSQCGYQVTAFTDPEAALLQFSRDPEAFEAVISDLTMPHVPGLELAQIIHHARPDIPIVLMTGNAMSEEFMPLHGGVIRKVMIKPFTMKDLVEVLGEVLFPK